MNGSDADHGLTRLRCALVVFAQATVAPLPSVGPLHDPTHRQRLEFRLAFRTTHDLQVVRPPVARQPSAQGITTIPGIPKDHLQPREVAPAYLSEEVLGRPGVVHVGGRHHDGDQETQGIHEDMALATMHLLTTSDTAFYAAQRCLDRWAVDRCRTGGR